MSNPLFAVDPEIISSVVASNNWLWQIPNTANRKGDPHKDGGEAYWNEEVEIVSSECVADEKNEGGVLIKVGFAVPASSTSINFGEKPQTMWFRYTPAALLDKSHPKHKQSNLHMDRLVGLMGALGVDVSNGLNFDVYMNEQGGQKWAVGKRCVVLVKHNWYKQKPRQEFIEYMPVSGA